MKEKCAEQKIERMKQRIAEADAVILGAGAGLSTAAGFDKKRLFYTQGDYGLFQCSKPCCQKTYDNEAAVSVMMESQEFIQDDNGKFVFPQSGSVAMKILTELVSRCPECGAPMTMSLRADDSFVQDAGWDAAAESEYNIYLPE